MKTAPFTPSERLRPDMGRPRIEYAPNGKYVVRDASLRMDPNVSSGERRFNRFMEQAFVAAVWFIGIPVLAYAFYWALFEGSKIVYSFAFNHPLGR